MSQDSRLIAGKIPRRAEVYSDSSLLSEGTKRIHFSLNTDIGGATKSSAHVVDDTHHKGFGRIKLGHSPVHFAALSTVFHRSVCVHRVAVFVRHQK